MPKASGWRSFSKKWIITEKINNKEKTTIWVPKIERRCFQIVLSNVFVGSNILWLLKIEYALNILNILKSIKLRKKKLIITIKSTAERVDIFLYKINLVINSITKIMKDTKTNMLEKYKFLSDNSYPEVKIWWRTFKIISKPINLFKYLSKNFIIGIDSIRIFT